MATQVIPMPPRVPLSPPSPLWPRAWTRWLAATALACAMAPFAQPAAAHMGPNVSFPQRDWSVGPSVGWIGDAHASGLALSAEVAWTHLLFSVSADVRYVRAGGQWALGPEVEFCGYAFANFGAGFGYLAGPLGGPAAHLFVGVPVGTEDLVGAIAPFRTGYVEPYYRPTYVARGEGRWVHELGVLFKMTTF